MKTRLAIVGATGAVGLEVSTLLGERRLDLEGVKLLASARSAGRTLDVAGQSFPVEEITERSFDDVEYAIFCAGSDRSRAFAPIAVQAGCVVIDNSSAFRMDHDVPLVVPEINARDLAHHKGIVANPNCSTIIMNMVVWPLHQVSPVERIVVSTYQAASGAGAAAVAELDAQTADVLAGRNATPHVFPHPIAFNLFSHDTPIGSDGYNAEERKMIDETRKIFHEPHLPISATCIRVPIRRAHSESIHLTFRRPVSAEEARRVLSRAPGVQVVDDPTAGRFPMPIDATGRNDCLVGRIRQDTSRSDGRGLAMFVCGDQLRKGAGLNAVQILELLMGGRL